MQQRESESGQRIRQFAELWQRGEDPNVARFLADNAGGDREVLIGAIMIDMRHRWRSPEPMRVEDYLAACSSLADDPDAISQLAVAEYRILQELEREPPVNRFVERFPEIASLLIQGLSEPFDTSIGSGNAPMTVDGPIRVRVSNPSDESRPCETAGTIASDRVPQRRGAMAHDNAIGRYRVIRLLGEGAFGKVYLAHDDDLNRRVAIKAPHPHRIKSAADAESYLSEARALALLDHPNIVPVYDLGRTPEGNCYVVSKFIEGCDLASRLKASPLSASAAAEIIRTIAEALHHAHQHGLVHRDIKPANILIESSDRAYLADFGLALREEDFGAGPAFTGTPSYMSPEQARGEGHRVDGRSDLFSLGVVFYELLAGKRPFRGATVVELLDQIATLEPRPPRQSNDAIPRELERICPKMLSKRASDRYPTGLDLADDIRQWQASCQGREERSSLDRLTPSLPDEPAAASTSMAMTRIVPKGLRSFDDNDADFFLSLLSGPRDRDGLPESIRFWKTLIEERDADKTFSIGSIYGPSGCGKSSLVKAGLLPRVAANVECIYVEATAADTTARILRALRKECPALPPNARLSDVIAAIRRGKHWPPDRKLLIVIDQLEQWLHVAHLSDGEELVQSLRQCDGSRVQCLLLVRDDFWMALTRLMRWLEVDLIPGINTAAVDLFELRHARKVLAAFGRAFGALPQEPDELSPQQEAFLDEAVAGIAEAGTVISVRLALFAEMIKGMPWTIDTLKELGGAEGVGVTFLEETIGDRAKHPHYRLHQKAIRSFLKALMPEEGSDIRGHMRSRSCLAPAAGYENLPKDFEQLLQILDNDLRLITPTDPEGLGGESSQQALVGETFYQLTHDFMVPPLREWLTRKQRASRRGRAELRLADRAAAWQARPENRRLPSWWEWLVILANTRPRDWTLAQAKMMRTAGRVHVLRAAALALVAGIVALVFLDLRGRTRADLLVDRLTDANTEDVPNVLAAMRPYRRWLAPPLQRALASAQASKDARRELHVRLALQRLAGGQSDELRQPLFECGPAELNVILQAIADDADSVVADCWTMLATPARGKQSSQLQAAAALAVFAPDDPRWESTGGLAAELLVAVNPIFLGDWMEIFRPVRAALLPQLTRIYLNEERRESERILAANLLADYAADRVGVLTDLLLESNERQFAVIFPMLRPLREQAIWLLEAELRTHAEAGADDEESDRIANRHANAAIALFQLDRREALWPALAYDGEPRVRSFLIHKLCPLGVEAQKLVDRLVAATSAGAPENGRRPASAKRTAIERAVFQPEASVRRALILALGEYSSRELAVEDRAPIIEFLDQLFRDDPDPGVHAACEWLLSHWSQQPRIDAETKRFSAGGAHGNLKWLDNQNGDCLVVIPGPSSALIGSPDHESGRGADEVLHQEDVDYSFAIASKEVTIEQFLRFKPDFDSVEENIAPERTCPVHAVLWYEAAAYCNWLSKEEGIPDNQWCYLPNEFGLFASGMSAAPDFLQRDGYRLPTEVEWELSTRACARTAFSYGSSKSLVGKYSWYFGNAEDRLWPVGDRKPNDLGLFDCHGNVFEWCHNAYRPYPLAPATEDITGQFHDIRDEEVRVLRGGSYDVPPIELRCGYRYRDLPTSRHPFVGFRVARTIKN